MKNKNIEQYNENGQRHGYWEMYFNNGRPYYKGFYHNDEPVGYWEFYQKHNDNVIYIYYA